VWWAAAERRETLLASLGVLGKRLDSNLERVDDLEVLARQALTLVARSAQPWLFVYDNVETPDTVRGLLPESGASPPYDEVGRLGRGSSRTDSRRSPSRRG
jgi:hypothetical protein